VREGIPRFVAATGDAVAVQTAESFGFQWTRYARRIPEWKRRCREFFGRFAPEELGRGVVLDAGCGYGRWLAEVAEGGGTVVGLDVSEAVDAAAAYVGDAFDCHLVQGDVLNPPFRPAVFETVYSIGVLHHLTRGADGGIRALRPLLRPGGLLFVWLYGSKRGDDRSTPYFLLRRVTRLLPRPALAPLCAMGAVAVSLAFVLPKRLLARWPRTRRLSDRIPFHTYRDLPLSELRTDLFDMFATPIEHGYGPGAVRSMLEESGLEGVEVTPLGTPRNPQASWRGWGYAPRS
jgi:SAM-dependent methyltransferase